MTAQAPLSRLWQWAKSDPWQAFLLLMAPWLMGLLLYAIFSARSPVELPVSWLDEDHSALSRELSRALEATPAIRLVEHGDAVSSANALRRGEVYAQVRVPANFSADLRHGLTPTLDVRYNGQYLLMGKRLKAPIQLALADALQRQGALAVLAKGLPAAAVSAQLAPVSIQLTALNNRGMDYAAFLLPGLCLAIWQILVLFSVLNLYFQPPAGQAPGRWLWAVLALQWGWAGLGIYWMRDLLMVAHNAPLWPLWLALLPLMVPLTALALVLVKTGRESAQLVSSGAALLTPAFTYMGLTMPTGSMPTLAQWWADLIPSSHYLPLLQSYRGLGTAPWLDLWPLLLPLPVAWWLWRRLP
ncbi:ABC transporter permease [Ferrimonas balearica]|uniref:ABC transporter permease n=1 Tax=Ferrimonas balearica TaxID=44012 RepID=UPI002D7E266D|nr:ABC transporter permease [Ferrimonas balearica]MBY6019110.1 ABC transporter permease [Halomonas denitrificans]MBY6095714.1 ABC transporter permease [Ferrimonas balearica]